jgi:tetratricopeptide (TPR) repeat protein
MRSARNERCDGSGSLGREKALLAILICLAPLGPTNALAQGLPRYTPEPTQTEVRGRGAEAREEEEDSKSSSDMAKARKAIREGRAEEGLSILKGLRAQGDRRPAIAYWMGRAYETLGLFELAWRELHIATLYQPANRAYGNALRSVERTLETGVPPPGEGTPTPAASSSPGPTSVATRSPSPAASPTSAASPTPSPTPEPVDERLEALRIRSERALRNGRPRLSVGLGERYLAEKPEAWDVLLSTVDAAIQDGAAALARRLFDRHPQSKDPELEGLRLRLTALEGPAKKAVVKPGEPVPEPTDLEQARGKLDQLFLDEARELLERLQVQSPKDPQILVLLASVYALRGEDAAARAFVEEAAFDDPALGRYLERPELLELSPLRPPHQTVLEPKPTAAPTGTPQAKPTPP